MIQSNFLSSQERLALERCVRRHVEEHGISRRANAILLLGKGKSCAEIAEFLHLDDDTVRGWHKAYIQAGWDALSLDGWQGGQSRMTAEQEAELIIWLEGPRPYSQPSWPCRRTRLPCLQSPAVSTCSPA